MKQKKVIIWAIIILLLLGVYTLTGFFVVQPISAVPNWVTIWYLRYQTNLPFISSADGLSLDRVWSVSLLSRGVALKSASEAFEGKIIARLPYMDFLYSISTDWQNFDR